MTGRDKILIERYRLGELPDDMVKEIEQREDLSELLDEYDKSDKKITNDWRFQRVGENLKRSTKSDNKSAVRKRFSVIRTMAAAAGIAVIVGAGLFMTTVNSGSSNGIRVKGEQTYNPDLTIYRQIGDEVEKLNDGDTANAGDLIQIGYKGIQGDLYGIIISIDGRGKQTIHYPMVGEEAELLDNTGESVIPWSYELDAAPEYEAFYLITSRKPFSLKDIKASALMENKVPKNVDITGFLLKKGE